jgi:lactoylglutathione lyase
VPPSAAGAAAAPDRRRPIDKGISMTEPRMVGVGLHVSDLDRSIDFYTNVLGMRQVARHEFDGVTEVLVGYGAQGESPSLVLVARAQHPSPLDVGNGFDRVLVMVDDVRLVCERLLAFGCEVSQEPTELPDFPVVLAMAKDPDGYGLELLETRSS